MALCKFVNGYVLAGNKEDAFKPHCLTHNQPAIDCWLEEGMRLEDLLNQWQQLEFLLDDPKCTLEDVKNKVKKALLRKE